MTKEERRIRFKVAMEIANQVYVDMCHDRTGDISRENTTEFCDFIIDMQKFYAKMFPKSEN